MLLCFSNTKGVDVMLLLSVLPVFLVVLNSAKCNLVPVEDYPTNYSIHVQDCPYFESVPNGFIEVKHFSGMLKATVKCNGNYSLIGRAVYYCNENKWIFEPDEMLPKCVKRCPSPPYLEHGEIQLEKLPEDLYSPSGTYLSGTVAKFSCIDDYILDPPSSSIRLCENGYWSGKDAYCKVKIESLCDSPPPIEHGIIQPTFSASYPLIYKGDEVRYSCQEGYKLIGSNKIKCSNHGIWIPSVPKCEREDELFTNLACASIPLLDPKKHGNVKIIAISSTTVELGCENNYQNILSPCQSTKFFCKNGQWIGLYPECVEIHTCSSPPAIPHAEIVDHDFDKIYDTTDLPYFPISTRITYQCMTGYALDGSRAIACQANGCWEPAEIWPTCIRTKGGYFDELDGLNAILISSATGAGVLGVLLLACLIVACKKRKDLVRTASFSSTNVPSTGQLSLPNEMGNDHAVLLRHPDRVALISFVDELQNNQNALPSYDEAVRDRSTLIQVSRLQIHRSRWHNLAICRGSNRSRNSPNIDSNHHTHGSITSHTPSMRSGGESMGSTDTVTISEGSTNITLDTASSHSTISQNPSCRGHCGSLASFDACSVVNTDGVPLLEESELEDVQGGTNNIEDDVTPDNVSLKNSTNSAPIM